MPTEELETQKLKDLEDIKKSVSERSIRWVNDLNNKDITQPIEKSEFIKSKMY